MPKASFDRVRAVAVAGVCSLGVSGLLLSSADGSTTHVETLYLNTYESAQHDIAPSVCVNRGGCGPEVKASRVLVTGRAYVVKVTGAVSASGSGNDHRYGCGNPQPKPEFKSPGIASQPANVDAQFLFAQTIYGTARCPKLPRKSGAFEIRLSGSSRWFHPIAVGTPRYPSNDKDIAHDQHPYTFTVVGRGAAPRFRFLDYFPVDNDGEFRIQILTNRRTSVARLKFVDGWLW
jgi:hypothetical protein